MRSVYESVAESFEWKRLLEKSVGCCAAAGGN
jgi:hypothetical protein